MCLDESQAVIVTNGTTGKSNPDNYECLSSDTYKEWNLFHKYVIGLASHCDFIPDQ